MICADSSSFIAFTRGETQPDVEAVVDAMAHQLLVLAPVSVTELMSDPNLSSALEALITSIPLLEIKPGYWKRAGKLRSLLMKRHHRPKIADTLIAQSCLDHDVPLVTRDQDFQAFRRYAGLKLL
jgi:predicted nucleic acid-binding protein